MATDERGYVDNERKWNRGQLHRLIRMELVALGLIPGADGIFQSPSTPREPDGPAPDGHYWDGYKWVDTQWSVDHPPVHHEWIDGYKIGERVYHPSDVSILIKQAPNFAEQPELPGRRDAEQSIRHLTEHLDRGELLCKCYDDIDNTRKD